MHRNQTSQKSPTEHLTEPLGTPTPKEREGSSMLTWIHVSSSWWFLYCFSLGYFLLDSLTHTHTPSFFVWMLQNRNPPQKKRSQIPWFNGEVFGPTAKGWAQEGLKTWRSPRFPVFFSCSFFSVEGGLMKFFLPIQNFPKPPGFSFGRNLKSEKNKKKYLYTWGSEWKFNEAAWKNLSSNTFRQLDGSKIMIKTMTHNHPWN